MLSRSTKLRRVNSWYRSLSLVSPLFAEDVVLSRGEKDFQQWVKDQQELGACTIHPDVIVERSADKGFRLLAKKDIDAGSSLIQLNASLYESFSAQSAEKYMMETNPGFHYQVGQFAASITPQEQQQKNLIGSMCLAVQFLFSQTQSDLETDHYREQRLAQGGFGPAYARMLFENTYPWADRMPHALSIPEDLIAWMNGTGLYRSFSSRRSLYNQLSQRVLGQEMQVTQLSSVMAIILSRAMSGQDSQGKPLPLGMVPVIDFANHADEPNARHSYSEDKALLLEALPSGGGIAAGSEICISYGDTRDSASFLSLYSFLPKPILTQAAGRGAPKHLINPNDLLGITVSGDSSSTKRRVNLPQAVIFASLSLLEDAKESGGDRAVVKMFEGLLAGYLPNVDGAGATSVSAAIDRLDPFIHALELEEKRRDDLHRRERPEGALEPLYLAKCRSENEKIFLSMCEEVLESERAAIKALLGCCQTYRAAYTRLSAQ